MDTRFSRLCQLGQRCGGSDKATKALVELQALSAICRYVSFWRIRYKEGKRNLPFPSLLIWIEAPSGGGKNAISFFYKDEIFKSSIKYMMSLLQIQADAFLIEEKKRLKALYNFDDNELDKKGKEKMQKRYDTELAKYFTATRDLDLDHWDDGTYEGFAKERAYMAKFRFGSKNLTSPEFSDRIKQMVNNSHLSTMYGRLFELVDNPELGTKHIKDKEGKTEGSTGMGTNIYLTHSLLNPQLRLKVMDSILTSVGRRGFLLRETNETITSIRREEPTDEEVDDLSSEILKMTEFLDDYCSNKDNYDDESGVVIKMDEGALAWYLDYKEGQRELLNKMYKTAPSEKKDLLLALMQDGERKVQKVACLLAIFNHYEDFRIKVEDLEHAQVLVESFMENAKNFFNMAQYNQSNQIIAYLRGKEGEWVSARELFESGVFGKVNRDSFQIPIKDTMMRDIALDMEKLNYNLEYQEYNRQDQYRVTVKSGETPSAPPVIKEEVKSDTGSLIPLTEYSFTSRPGLALAGESGFTLRRYPKDKVLGYLAPILKGEYVYSAVQFKDNLRKTGGQQFVSANLVILDFDDGMKFEEAQEIFKEYDGLIATTTHHRKIKHVGEANELPACDRFRVVMFGDTQITDTSLFKATMALIGANYKADPSCSDSSRIYRGAVGAEVIRLSGSLDFPLLDWSKQAEKEIEERKKYFASLPPSPDGEVRVSADKRIASMMIRVRNNIVDAKEFAMTLPADRTYKVPIYCPMHEDNNASAFISRWENGLIQLTCTGSCRTTKYIQ